MKMKHFGLETLEQSRTFYRFEKNLPNVQIHYAMKCCNEPNLLKYLIENGIRFDCASRTEIEIVLGFEVRSSQIVFHIR
jgi:ornithine decarboxylase